MCLMEKSSSNSNFVPKNAYSGSALQRAKAERRVPLRGAMEFGELIRKTRKDKGLSQAELAFRTPMNESYLSSVECGYSFITINKFLQLCKSLDVSPSDLMDSYYQLLQESSSTML